MAGQSSERSTRRARTTGAASSDAYRARTPANPRGWLFNGLSALAVSALALAVAGSVALTSSAETPDNPRTSTSAVAIAPAAPGAEVTPSPPPSKALRAFAPAPPPAGPLSTAGRTPAVRKAIVKELSAQRTEDLAKAAEDATKVTRAAATAARQTRLTEANQSKHEAAAALVEESVRKAVAARLAATQDRTAAEQEAPLDPAAVPVPAGGTGVSPVPGAVIGAHFGQYGLWSRYHTGLDFRAAYGTPIKAVKAGVVLYAGNSGDWAGNHVAVKHVDGTTTMYSHMSSMAARVGATVQAGQVIGYVGQTGRAFGAHLHFELYPAGVKYGDVYKAINPQSWLSANGVHTR